MEKAKLKYDGLSYYDEDLEKIAKIFCNENKFKYQKYSVDRILESVLVWYGKKGSETMFKIPFENLKNYSIPLTNEKPVINWPSSWGHFIYYRKDIWELADLVTKWNGFKFKEYKLDNRGKFLYIYFYHPVGKDAFLAMSYNEIERVRFYLHKKDTKGLMLKAKAWGNNLEI